MKECYAKFLNKGGYESQREEASKVFQEGKPYKVIGGYIGKYDSRFIFEDVRGSWNTVMFDLPWEEAQHLMEHGYNDYI